MENDGLTGMISALDQGATVNENMAKLVGQFHQNLLDEGIPQKLASKLVLLYYKRLLYPIGEE